MDAFASKSVITIKMKLLKYEMCSGDLSLRWQLWSKDRKEVILSTRNVKKKKNPKSNKMKSLSEWYSMK